MARRSLERRFWIVGQPRRAFSASNLVARSPYVKHPPEFACVRGMAGTRWWGLEEIGKSKPRNATSPPILSEEQRSSYQRGGTFAWAFYVDLPRSKWHPTPNAVQAPCHFVCDTCATVPRHWDGSRAISRFRPPRFSLLAQGWRSTQQRTAPASQPPAAPLCSQPRNDGLK